MRVTDSPRVADAGLHSAIAELVRGVCSESRPHPEDVLERFAVLASTHIPGVAHASVMLTTGKHGLRPSAASGGYPHLIDKLQAELGEGPALDAVAQRCTVRVDDLADDARWPRFTPAMLAQTPVLSMLSCPLYSDVHDWGALGLYATHPHAFDDKVERAAVVLATHAAVTLQVMHRSRQIRSALGSRDIIGQAKGMLMERYGIGAGAAFTLLTQISQRSDLPVVVIAKEIVSGGQVPQHRGGQRTEPVQ